MHPEYQTYEMVAKALPLDEIAQYIPGFSPPTQDRTRIKTARMIAVTASLLRTRSFNDIAVQEIADASACSVTSIYARFNDKEAILPAILFLIMAIYGQRIDDQVEQYRYEDATLDDLCRDLVFAYDEIFVAHENFIKATLISQAGKVDAISDYLLDQRVEKITVVAAPMVARSFEDTVDSVRFAMQVTLSVFRGRAMVGDFSTGIDKEAVVRLFATIVRMNLTDKSRLDQLAT